ncbi:MAG: CehA/McbA family metallohydrolase, partial [Flavitalea sp.]
MKKNVLVLIASACIYLLPLDTGAQKAIGELPVNMHIDGSKRMQQIDGIGVNANTSSWTGEELEPALTLLLDSLKANIWRVIVEPVEKWEDVNDNNDPFSFNWDYYNTLYSTPKFEKVWGMMKYLNQHGITDNLIVNFMGFAPSWMGVKIIKPEMEDEYVEMIVSFFYYALNNRHLKFGFIAPTNESDHHKFSEGPHLDAKQHARIVRKTIDRMEALGIMGNIRIIAPDNASLDSAVQTFIPAMMEDSVVMSKVAHLGFHTYGGYSPKINEFIRQSPYPHSSFWITEWNAWRDGLDDGIIGVYDYTFASQCVWYLLDLLRNGATAAIEWEGYDSYYEHHRPSLFSYWGILSYDKTTKTYSPRKHFYALQQVSRFITPGSWQVNVSAKKDSLSILAFQDDKAGFLTIVGENNTGKAVVVKGNLANLPGVDHFEMSHTSREENLHKDANVVVKSAAFTFTIPAYSIFTLKSAKQKTSVATVSPEPANWYAGDIHVHRNCGDSNVLSYEGLTGLMEPNNLAVISVLADMGNGEVKYSQSDLPKVNGKDASQSRPKRIIHWDTEWHWDATYSAFDHQALGGHLVLLNLKEAQQIWDESPYKVLNWAAKQKAVRGFAHMEYLNDKVQDELNCCIPIDYPVEAAMGTIDFVSEDVYGVNSPNNGNYNSEAAISAYYKLLNCGFRTGLAAGTDFPCNDREPLGKLLTYVKVKDALTYDKWAKGIKNGRTVVSRDGHNEFIDMTINGKYGPGDELALKNKGKVSIEVKWTSIKEASGKIELVLNGKVVASKEGTAKPGSPL